MRFTPICAAVTAALAFAGPAAADPPTRVTQTIVVDEPEVRLTCDNGSEVLQTYTIHRTLTTFTDASGDVVRTSRQARIVGVVFTEDGSRQAPFEIRIHRVEDVVKGIRTVSGLRQVVELPGPDARAAGRVVLDLESLEELKEAGRGFAPLDEAICAHLYG
jgi:hypothetical protein